MNRKSTFAGLLASAVLAGCGGGGDSGNSGGNNGGATTFTISPATLTFTANHDDPNPPAAQTVTVTTNRPGTTYFQFEGGNKDGLNCGGSSCTFQVRPGAPYSYSNPTTGNGGKTVVGCADLFCASPVGQATVTWTYTITPGMNVTPDAVLFASEVEGVAPAPVEITLTHPSGTVQPWQASFVQAAPYVNNPMTVTFAPSSSLTPMPSGSKIQAQIAPTSQLGTFNGWIEVHPGGTPRNIQRLLTYQVVPALRAPTSASFTINTSSTLADLQKNITIGSNYPAGMPPINWTATEDSAWLQISPASGGSISANQLTLSLVQSTLERLPKGIHHASVVISSPPDPSAPQLTRSNVTIDVVLDMQLPLADYAMPHVVLTGTSGETFIRGSGFTGLPGTVSFGSSPANSVNRVDDTLIRANYPAFNSAGSYAIDLGIGSNALLLNRSRAHIVAITPPTYTAANIASPGEKYAALFDDQRNALYVADVENGEIERYRYLSGAWTQDALAVTGLKDIVLMPDGSQLLALTSNGLALINPDALTVIETRAFAIAGPNRSLAVTNDGQIVFARADVNWALSGVRYDLNLGTLTQEFGCCANRYIRASGDGSVLYFVASLFQAYKLDTRTRNFTYSPLFNDPPMALSVSRDGSRLMIDATRLVDSSFNLVATLATGGEALTASVVAPDGKRAYAYADSGRLYTFNVDAAQGTPVTQIGLPITLSAVVGASPKMAVSLDGRTVFIAGNARVIVQPGPP